MPDGLTLSTNGVLSGTPATAIATNMTITVTDSANRTANKVFNITILTAPVITSGATMVNGQIGFAYSQTLAATGGQLPYTWTLTGGSLPAGLGLSTGGVVSGTPTAVGGPTTFEAQVRDNLGGTARRWFSISIVTGPSITTSSPLPDGVVGVSYSQQLTVSGGVGPYTWSKVSGDFPVGLSISTAGVISGMPTTAGGPTIFKIRVTDSQSSIGD